MIRVMPIKIWDCPDAIQIEVKNRLKEANCEILSATVIESTPYKDKSVISKQYRIIMNQLNLVSVLHCYGDGPLKDKVITNELIWGDILEIIRTAPNDSSLAELRKAIPEKVQKLLNI